jgi:hypothetical protein
MDGLVLADLMAIGAGEAIDMDTGMVIEGDIIEGIEMDSGPGIMQEEGPGTQLGHEALRPDRPMPIETGLQG